MTVIDIYKAFGAGKEIANSVRLKNQQNLTNGLVAVITVALGAYRFFVGPLPITDEQVIGACSLIASLILLGNNIVATITTKKDVTITGITKTEVEK